MPRNDSDQYASVIRGVPVSNAKEKEEKRKRGKREKGKKEEEEKEDEQEGRTYGSWRPKIAEIL